MHIFVLFPTTVQVVSQSGDPHLVGAGNDDIVNDELVLFDAAVGTRHDHGSRVGRWTKAGPGRDRAT